MLPIPVQTELDHMVGHQGCIAPFPVEWMDSGQRRKLFLDVVKGRGDTDMRPGEKMHSSSFARRASSSETLEAMMKITR